MRTIALVCVGLLVVFCLWFALEFRRAFRARMAENAARRDAEWARHEEAARVKRRTEESRWGVN